MAAPSQVVDIRNKLSRIDEVWSPKILAEANGWHVKLVKGRGQFTWHRHPDVDEIFCVLSGSLTITSGPGGDVVLGPARSTWCRAVSSTAPTPETGARWSCWSRKGFRTPATPEARVRRSTSGSRYRGRAALDDDGWPRALRTRGRVRRDRRTRRPCPGRGRRRPGPHRRARHGQDRTARLRRREGRRDAGAAGTTGSAPRAGSRSPGCTPCCARRWSSCLSSPPPRPTPCRPPSAWPSPADEPVPRRCWGAGAAGRAGRAGTCAVPGG